MIELSKTEGNKNLKAIHNVNELIDGAERLSKTEGNKNLKAIHN